MAYLAKINGTELKRIKKYEVSLPKLSTDAGRNMKGNLKVTHLGIFPKLSLEFRPMTEEQMAEIGVLLDNPSFTLEWWNPISRSYKTDTFYSGDTSFSLILKDKRIYDSFKVSIIAFNAMT